MLFTADQLVAHLVGDYLLQSHWMASEKVKSRVAANCHAVAYALPFIFLRPSLLAFVAIIVSHFVIDHWRLARYVVWAKNWLLCPFWQRKPQQAYQVRQVLNDTTLTVVPSGGTQPSAGDVMLIVKTDGPAIKLRSEDEGCLIALTSPLGILLNPGDGLVVGDGKARKHARPWMECSKTGYPPDAPIWLATWLTIIADNCLHLICNALALRYL
jgi:hypothetical protein